MREIIGIYVRIYRGILGPQPHPPCTSGPQQKREDGPGFRVLQGLVDGVIDAVPESGNLPDLLRVGVHAAGGEMELDVRPVA